MNSHGAHGLLVNLVQNIFAHKVCFLPKHTQDISCTNSPRRTISGDVRGTQQQKEQTELNTRERKRQHSTKMMSALADSCIQFLWSVVPMTALTWMVKNMPNRTTIEDVTEEIDEGGCVRQYNFLHQLIRMLRLCLAVMNLMHSVALPSSSLVTMVVLIPHWVVNSDRLSPEEDRSREDYYYEALAFSRHTVDLEFDDETMRRQEAQELIQVP